MKMLICCVVLPAIFTLSLAAQSIYWQNSIVHESEFYSGDYITQSADGGFLICGSVGAGGYTAHVSKLDAGGALEWQQYFGDSERPVVMPTTRVIADRRYRLLSFSRVFASRFAPFVPMVAELEEKQNKDGRNEASLLSTNFDSQKANYIWGSSAAMTTSNDALIVADIDDSSLMPSLTIRWLTADAQFQSSASIALDPDSLYTLRSIIAQPEGGYLLAGNQSPIRANKAGSNLFVRQLNNDGTPAWHEVYPQENRAYAADLLLNSDGSFLLLAEVINAAAPGSHIELMNIGADGRTQHWKRSYAYRDYNHCASIIAIGDQGYFIVGSTGFYDAERRGEVEGSRDVLAIRIDKDGGERWHDVFGASDTRDMLTAAVYEPNKGQLIATGISEAGNLLLVAYNDFVSVGIANNAAPRRKLSVGPNPFKNFVTFQVDGLSVNTVRFALYDERGAKVHVAAAGSISRGKRSISVQLDNLPRAVYYYELQLDDQRSYGSLLCRP